MSLVPLRRTLGCTRRAFSTTPRPRVSPESPHYIEIPRPPTVRVSARHRQKGKLPHPKSIRDDVLVKPATSEPSPRRLPTNVDDKTIAYITWKQNLAESRRRNLREGVHELQQRQKQLEKHRALVLQKRSESREILLAAKQREDVRLTLPSVLSTLRVDDGSKMVRISKERLAEKKAAWAAKEAQKSATRIENFHELYLNAREFILTEKQLDEAIEREFTQKDHLYKTLPQTVEDMLQQVQNNRGDFGRDKKMLEISGRLTGSRLEPKRARGADSFGLDEEADELVSRDFRVRN
ncbi:hypothetical protein Q9L58_000189 [Maublancomyces gigas]|uniref:Uncharacterized protein n=1 Tax=Discina gigas TaxID=1032678 RepID=A0ABR3GY52_9PEZI